MDPKQSFLAIIVVESQGLPTMKCQTKCAKAVFGRRFLDTVTAIPRGTAVTAPKKRPPKIAFAHFVWHFIVGKPWDSTTIIAKKPCFGIHAQVSLFHYKGNPPLARAHSRTLARPFSFSP